MDLNQVQSLQILKNKKVTSSLDRDLLKLLLYLEMQVCLSHLKKEMMIEILTKEVKNLLAIRLNLKRRRKNKNLISINLVTAVLRI